MRVAKGWDHYKIIDTSGGEKLEIWGGISLVRPDPQVIWNTPKNNHLWKNCDAFYKRSEEGGGHWIYNKKIKEEWFINYKSLKFKIKLTGFKHTGLFPEQAVNWDFFEQKIKAAKKDIKVLNLFAYTGGATLACLKAGASVCHVDSSKGVVSWAKENAQLSHLDKLNVRWIVDDCFKFIEKEIRRGNKYDAIIMDPPSYGRGTKGEIFKLDRDIYSLIGRALQLLSEKPLFFVVNSYTTGLSCNSIGYILKSYINNYKISNSEIGLPVIEHDYFLPCGSTSICEF